MNSAITAPFSPSPAPSPPPVPPDSPPTSGLAMMLANTPSDPCGRGEAAGRVKWVGRMDRMKFVEEEGGFGYAGVVVRGVGPEGRYASG